MRRMIDMIRSSSVSATVMQAAARGALAVPGTEMIEILVHLANHNKIFGQQARMTLAGWDLKSSLQAASSPDTPHEVLEYLIAQENLQPRLLPALLENPSIPEATLLGLAEKGSREVVVALRHSERVKNSPALLQALAENPHFREQEAAALVEQAAELETAAAKTEPDTPSVEPEPPSSPEDDAAIHAYLAEHTKELALEGDKPYQPLGGFHELELHSAEPEHAEEHALTESPADPAHAVAETAASPDTAQPAATAARKAHLPKKPPSTQDSERGSVLQKIAKLDVKGRIQLAMKGTKEERSILVRDGTKLVALAVLESGKITDGEVEKFASQKNVLEAVLRQIPMKRRFAKNYNVIRNLVANPRTPLDVSLGLMKNILVSDLRNLSSNKEVPDTIRKLATKMFKAKTDPTKKSQ